MMLKKTVYQNLCGTAKAIFRGKFFALHKYIRKEESLKISNLGIIGKRKGNYP